MRGKKYDYYYKQLSAKKKFKWLLIQGIQYGLSPILASKETRKRVKKKVFHKSFPEKKKTKTITHQFVLKNITTTYYILLLILIIIISLLWKKNNNNNVGRCWKILKREKKWFAAPNYYTKCSILLQLFYAECQKVCFFLLFVCASVHIEINYRLLEFWRIIFSSNRNI